MLIPNPALYAKPIQRGWGKMAGDDKAVVDAEKGVQPTVEFHYIKSSQFRVIHADGAYGGVTARGYLHITFYNERRAIPQKTELVVDADTTAPHEVITASRGGVVRECEVGVLLDENGTTELIEWLKRKLDDFRTLRGFAKQQDEEKDA